MTKRFGSRVAFESLTFEVARGEVFGFLGPNGAGKTTTVRVLGTLLEPSAGTAEVAGISLEGGAELRSRISILPERPGLYLRLSVKDNMEYFAGLHGIPRPDRPRRIAAALEAVGLSDRLGDLTGYLSKGLQQRAALARSMLNDPEVIFLDEPTQGLDARATRDVRELIDGLRTRGVTVFLTTHRLEEAERLCDRVAIVNATLRSIGSPRELRRRLFGSALEIRVDRPLPNPEATFGAVPVVQEWETVDGRYIVHVDDPKRAAPILARTIVDSGAGLVRLAEVERTLEEVYLQLLRDEEAS